MVYHQEWNSVSAVIIGSQDYESVGRAFESLQAHHKIQALTLNRECLFYCLDVDIDAAVVYLSATPLYLKWH